MMIAKFVRRLIALRDDPLAGVTQAEMNLLAIAEKEAIRARSFNFSFGSKRMNGALAFLLWRKGHTATILYGGSSCVYAWEAK